MTITQLKKKTIGFISLGCDKNRVDLERIISSAVLFGFKVVTNASLANIIIVNTCAFINSAREEAINAILESAEHKKNKCEKLIVTGCLPVLNKDELNKALPEVDAYVKINDNNNIIKIIAKLYGVTLNEYNHDFSTRELTTKSFAYLKISEGCDNFCSYCTIPFIRGRFKSEPIEVLVKEAQEIANKGIGELILVAQDVTNYGLDLYKKPMLVQLIKKLSKVDGINWIRLLYCYPEKITPELIKEIKNNNKVCKYIDIPLQHVNDEILKKMNRKSTKKQIVSVINNLRKNVPGITIRSTFILGFPGETEEKFTELIEFLKEYNLDQVGFFAYSKEPGTGACNFKNHISKAIKNKRVKDAYNVQAKIQATICNKLLGKIITVIIDKVDKKMVIARTSGMTPNVDNVVFIKNQKAIVGKLYNVKITQVVNNNLIGEFI